MDKFLGQVNITTLSGTSQSAALPPGTRYVQLATDADETVYFAFGVGSTTATTASQRMFAGQAEGTKITGIGGKSNNTIAARIAS